MTTEAEARIRARGPQEIVDLVPYLIGFHPTNSLVIVGLRNDPDALRSGLGSAAVEVAMRVDLEPATRDGDRIRLLNQLIAALVRADIHLAVALVYTEDHEPDPLTCQWLSELDHRLSSSLSQAEVWLLALLVVDSTRWWSLSCSEQTCCPPAGTPHAGACSVTAAEATMAGLVALDSREALERTLDGEDPAHRARLEPFLARAEDRVVQARLDHRIIRLRRSDRAALLSEMQDRNLGRKSGPMSARRLARFAVALSDIALRDELWVGVDDRTYDLDDVLRELLAQLPSPYDAAPLFLFGWSRWRSGVGTVAGMAAERALASDPTYSAAELLLAAVNSGLDPHTTPTLREPV